MNTKLIDNNGKNLIVFLTGWGCDDNQFSFMQSDNNFDILICYDYSTPDFDFDFSKYEKKYLIAFSAGVFMAGVLKDKLPPFEKTIAINGNPLAYDEYFGLRKEIVDIFTGVTKENALDFRRKYLVFDDKEFRLFNKYCSKREFENCFMELIALKSYQFENPLFFDVAILSENDKIFDFKHQKEYWSNEKFQPDCKCITLKNSAHFPFFRLNNYTDIINL